MGFVVQLVENIRRILHIMGAHR